MPRARSCYASLVSVMLYMGHLLGCGLHMVTTFYTPTEACVARQLSDPGRACEWTDLIAADDSVDGGKNVPLATRYISSLCWVLAAMSTVGRCRALSKPPWSLRVLLPLPPVLTPPTHTPHLVIARCTPYNARTRHVHDMTNMTYMTYMYIDMS